MWVNATRIPFNTRTKWAHDIFLWLWKRKGRKQSWHKLYEKLWFKCFTDISKGHGVDDVDCSSVHMYWGVRVEANVWVKDRVSEWVSEWERERESKTTSSKWIESSLFDSYI